MEVVSLVISMTHMVIVVTLCTVFFSLNHNILIL